MRKHLASLLLIALALAVTAYAYFADRGTVTDLERERRAKLLFPAFRRDEIDSIDIAHGSEEIRFEASDDDAGDRAWRMTAPAGDKGDSSAIDRLLTSLEYASYERKVPSGGGGFDRPRAQGTIAMRKVVYHFSLGGDATPPDGAAYFRLDGEGTFVIKRELVTELMKSADAYRDRSVVPYLSIDLSRFEIGGKVPWAIERMDDVSFKIASPSGNFQGIRASRQALDRVWTALSEMRAESFPSQEEATRALSPPLFTITMTPKEEKLPRALLALGGACSSAPDDVVLERREPTQLLACVPKGAEVGIATPLAELVDRHPFAAIVEEVEELSLENVNGGAKIEIARKGEGWHERAPADRDLTGDEAEMATALVKAILASDGEILTPSPKPFSPAFRAKITRGGSHVLETVELSGDVVHRIADDTYLTISDVVRHRLEPHVSALRAPEIWSSSLEGARIDHLSDDCAGAKQEIARDAAGRFHFQSAVTLAVDSANVIALAEAIERARATSWVADADDGSFGIAHGCSVAITTRGDAGDRQSKISFGGASDDHEIFARANDDPAIFTVPEALYDLANTLLVDRSVFFVDPDSIDEVDLARAGRHAHFSLRDGRDAGAVAGALGGLEATRAVHLGAPKSDEAFASPTLDVRVRSSGDSGARTLHFLLGAPTTWRDDRMFYARVEGVDATFLLLADRVRPLLDAVGERGP